MESFQFVLYVDGERHVSVGRGHRRELPVFAGSAAGRLAATEAMTDLKRALPNANVGLIVMDGAPFDAAATEAEISEALGSAHRIAYVLRDQHWAKVAD